MATRRVARIYEQHIKALPAAERLELLAMVARDLAEQSVGPGRQPRRSIMELHGLGKQLWEGVDAQEYVAGLRDEWERRAS